MRPKRVRLGSDPRQSIRMFAALIPAVLFLGCSTEEAPVNSRNFTQSRSKNSIHFAYSADSSKAPAPATSPAPARGPAALGEVQQLHGIDAASPARASGPAGAGEVEAPPALPRKIIYNAQIALVVESLNGFEAKVNALVKGAEGYISQTDQSSVTDAQRNASWTIRVPVERFDTFLAAVSRLGELQRSHLDSQDVTMEFYDIEARIANKQKEETRLLKHLADSTGKLEDILAVERELTRVRGEIEQMQGRIRYLGNLSALSTVTLTVSEVRDYVPPIRPTFAGQVARTFHESLETLIGFGKGTVLFAVAIAPWLPLVLFLALLFRWGLGKIFRWGLGKIGRLKPRAV